MTIHLTSQEQKVIRGILHGLSNEEISINLGLAVQTVKNHVASIMVKTRRQSRAKIIADFYLGHYDIQSFILEKY